MGYFEVDKEGLGKLLARRGKAFLLYEMLQNSWDTRASRVDVTFTKVPNRPLAELVVVDDDPDGFANITHAYTLFAESVKKDHPELRGRFNLGEKLVLALCKEARITSTTGSVIFTEDGERKTGRLRREHGSEVRMTLKMTSEEFAEVCDAIDLLIPPEGVVTVFNGRTLIRPTAVASFVTTLTTVRADDEGNLVRTARKTTVDVYEPIGDQKAAIYELGIPVVETGDRYIVDVQQKVPVSLDRDNVPPSYLRTLRAHVLNHTHHLLSEEEVRESWVTDAMNHPDTEATAVEGVLDGRYGEKRAVFDPNDPEANKRLVAEGYTIIHGGSFGAQAWKHIKDSGSALPSGSLRPTPSPYSDDPNAPPVRVVRVEDYTPGMTRTVALAKRVARATLGMDVAVRVVRPPIGMPWGACYGHGNLDLNLTRLGHAWFDGAGSDGDKRILALLLHEYAHQYESDHLSSRFADTIADLGAKLAIAVLDDPTVLR